MTPPDTDTPAPAPARAAAPAPRKRRAWLWALAGLILLLCGGAAYVAHRGSEIAAGLIDNALAAYHVESEISALSLSGAGLDIGRMVLRDGEGRLLASIDGLAVEPDWRGFDWPGIAAVRVDRFRVAYPVAAEALELGMAVPDDRPAPFPPLLPVAEIRIARFQLEDAPLPPVLREAGLSGIVLRRHPEGIDLVAALSREGDSRIALLTGWLRPGLIYLHADGADGAGAAEGLRLSASLPPDGSQIRLQLLAEGWDAAPLHPLLPQAMPALDGLRLAGGMLAVMQRQPPIMQWAGPVHITLQGRDGAWRDMAIRGDLNATAGLDGFVDLRGSAPLTAGLPAMLTGQPETIRLSLDDWTFAAIGEQVPSIMLNGRWTVAAPRARLAEAELQDLRLTAPLLLERRDAELSVDLLDLASVTARQTRFGEADLGALLAEFDQGSLRIEGMGPPRLDLRSRHISLGEIPVRAGDGRFALDLMPDGPHLSVIGLRLESPASPALFPPLRLTARLGPSGAVSGTVSGQDIAKGLEAELSGRLYGDTPGMRLMLQPVPFAPGQLQPWELSPLLPRLAEAVTGALRADLKLDPRDMPASADLLLGLDDIGLIFEQAAVAGLNGDILVRGLAPPRTKGGQSLAVKAVNADPVMLSDGQIDFRLDGDGVLRVDRADFAFAEGRIALSGLALQLDTQTQDGEAVLSADGISLARLFDIAEIEGLNGDGRLSGDLPIQLSPDGLLRLGGGSLAAEQPGRLRYTPGNPPPFMAGDDPQSKMLRQALQDFAYDELKLVIAEDGKGAGLQIKGQNPDFFEGRPVHLNVNVTGPLSDILSGVFLPQDVLRHVDAALRDGAEPQPGPRP